jgi:toxin ParE1/3/4
MPERFTPTYLPGFRQDTQKAVAWSEDHFGQAAADRYAELIQQALRDLIDEPTRPGTKSRPDLGLYAYVYHLAFSRDRVAGERVKTPRHFVIYRHVGDKVEFVRLLHDSRDLARHVPKAFRAE